LGTSQVDRTNVKRCTVPVVGIVGGIASGKTTVSALLAEKGAAVIDTDRIAHALLKHPDIREDLRQAFGPEIFDEKGSVRHRLLAEKAFDTVENTRKLNAIVHPPIIAEIKRQVAEARSRSGIRMIVLDAALLIETGLDKDTCDAVVFVRAGEAQRMERAAQARGWTADEFLKRQRRQMDVHAKERTSDFTVNNAGAMAELAEAVEEVMSRIEREFC